MQARGKDLGADPDYIQPPKLNGKVIKPNKYPACAAVHQMYYECSLVTESSFGKFLNRCGQLKTQLDECNVREQAIIRKARLAESKERQATIQAKMEAIEKRVADKLAGKEDPARPKSSWSFWGRKE